MSNRAQIILILACCVGALVFVGYQVWRPSGSAATSLTESFTERAKLTEFHENGVQVALFMESDVKGQSLLRATFTPDEGFHVYSKDLDPNKTGGIGMATRLELLPNSSVKAVGELLADVAPESHDGFDIYSDGPVQLRLPIQFTGAETNIPAQISVSYMACKTDGLCLRPVEGKILDVQLTSR